MTSPESTIFGSGNADSKLKNAFVCFSKACRLAGIRTFAVWK